MEFIKIIPSDNRLWEQVWRLYIDSFPQQERRRINSHGVACEHPDFHSKIIVENGCLLALLFYWKNGGKIYIEHFAVAPDIRGRKIGTSIITNFLLQNRNFGIILEIDPPANEISEKRMKFYERIGFVANCFKYEHPPYIKGGYTYEPVVMSYPDKLSAAEFENFKTYIYGTVMKLID